MITIIKWRKPKEYIRVDDKDIKRLCDELTYNKSISSGDVFIQKIQYGRKITFIVYRVEKVGEVIQSLDTLSRARAIEELKKIRGKK